MRSRKRALLVMAGLSLATLCLGACDWRLTITRYVVRTDKLTAPVTLLLLTDLHSCLYGPQQEQLLSAIHAQNPDVILLSGDIVDDDMPTQGAEDLLAGIAPYPCYYVTGNHEIWTRQVDTLKDMLRGYGAVVLEGTGELAFFRGQPLYICGVDDPAIGRSGFEEQLERALGTLDPAYFTVFLCHRPERFEQYAQYACDLVLSGHAHGGQVRLPYLLDGLFAPNQGFFPAYTHGVYTQNGTRMVVSSGLARESTRFPRVFNRPEIVVVTLQPGA